MFLFKKYRPLRENRIKMKNLINSLTMKHSFFVLLLFGMFACNNNTDVLESKIDSLEKQLADTYKPGFGEIMGSVQIHHSKLWFSGVNENWKLAEFEVHELTESVEDIEKYQKEREESKFMDMIFPALDSVSLAIKQKDTGLFKKSYSLLTKTCNECHQVTDYQFIIVKNPDTRIFHNQDFRLKQ